MKSKSTAAGISAVLFLLLIIMIKTVNVQAIGPEGTLIGLAGINAAVHNLTGTSELWYKITTILGYAALLLAALLALAGFIQFIRRKSLLKVDKEIIALGVLYVMTAFFYVLFEKVIINYRPVIMPGAEHPEASFPSSHTMLACVIMGSAIVLIKRYIKDQTMQMILKLICAVIMAVIVVGRLISGVHWFTDILGGVLISSAMVLTFSNVLDRL